MNIWVGRVPLVLIISFFLISPVGADPNHGRFLRDPSDSSIVFSYGNAAPTAFDTGVFCDTLNCGSIKFDYDTYLQKPDGTAGGGGALSGGFYLAPGSEPDTGPYPGLGTDGDRDAQRRQ